MKTAVSGRVLNDLKAARPLSGPVVSVEHLAARLARFAHLGYLGVGRGAVIVRLADAEKTDASGLGWECPMAYWALDDPFDGDRRLGGLIGADVAVLEALRGHDAEKDLVVVTIGDGDWAIAFGPRDAPISAARD